MINQQIHIYKYVQSRITLNQPKQDNEEYSVTGRFYKYGFVSLSYTCKEITTSCWHVFHVRVFTW